MGQHGGDDVGVVDLFAAHRYFHEESQQVGTARAWSSQTATRLWNADTIRTIFSL